MVRLVHGVGINDLKDNYPKKFSECMFYKTWKKMLGRCYDDKYHNTRPSYIGCSVHQDWIYFSNFKLWMEQQDWEGKALDKDILVEGNKIYSPETCIFIDKKINSFLTDCKSRRGDYPVGASWSEFHGKFRSYVSDGDGKNIFLGFFTNPLDAHKAWVKKKYELVDYVCRDVKDQRVIDSLKNKFRFIEE